MKDGKNSCIYCESWMKSKVRYEETKKGKTKHRRSCSLTDKIIKPSTSACRYFKPKKFFLCESQDIRIGFLMCISRHRKAIKNPNKKTNLYWDCRKCKQFEIEIEPICEQFEIKPRRKITRRKKEVISKRKITRRKKDEKPKRKITRRKKKRKITRR